MSETVDTKAMNRSVVAECRSNGGHVGGMFAGFPLLLPTSVGVRSGQPGVSPLVYPINRDRPIVSASKGGAPSHPDWYRNLVATPAATVEVGRETVPVRALLAESRERDRVYAQMAADQPQFAEYPRNTDRRIPVFVLERESAEL